MNARLSSLRTERSVPPPAGLFPPGDDDDIPSKMRRRLWRPIVVGSVVVAVFVVGMITFAAVFSIDGAVVAPSFVRVEENRKTIKHRDGGIVQSVRVHEGQRVNRGDLLMVLDDVQPRGQAEVLRSQFDNLQAQQVRFIAERDGRQNLDFPPELLARQSDPAIQALVKSQEGLFNSRLLLLNGQLDIQQQKIQQLETRIGGFQSQIDSVNRQLSLIGEELEGVRSLFEKGLATKTKYLQLQRAAADLEGQRGSFLAEITRSKEAIGESNIQIAQLRQQRISEATDGLRDVQTRIADTIPRLRTAEEILQHVEVRAPVGGYVHNLTQFTDGGVIAASERLLDIVPAETPLVIEARIKPEDISKVAPEMKAQVRLTAYKARVVPTIPADVTKVSADRMLDPKTGEGYFVADLRINPEDLRTIAPQVRLYPGMPADSMIATGERTILDYLLTPLTGGLATAMRDQ